MKHFFQILADFPTRILEFIEEFPSIFFIFLVILGSFLKFTSIGNSSLWLDETYSIFIAQQDIASIIDNFSRDQNPPLYFLILHYWIKIAGFSEIGTRSLSAIFSIVSAPLIFYIGRNYFNNFTGVAASLLFTLSPIQLYYAHETRTFAFVGFLCLLSYILLLMMLTEKQKLVMFLLAVVNAALVYSHFIAVFIPISQFIFVLLLRERDKSTLKMFFISGIISFALFLPWLRYVIINMPESGVYWLQKPTFYHLKGWFIGFSGGKAAAVIYLLVLAGASLSIWKDRNDAEHSTKYHQTFSLLLLWAFFPVAADYLVSYATPVFLNRYLLYASLGLYLLIGYSISVMKVHNTFKYVIMTALFVLASYSLDLKPSKGENWREAVQKVKENMQDGDLVLLSAWYANTGFSYYYETPFFRDYKNMEDSLRSDNIYCVNTLDEAYLKSLNPGRRVITVQSHQKDADPDNSVIQVISNFYYPSKAFAYEGIEINIFQKKDLMKVRKKVAELMPRKK